MKPYVKLALLHGRYFVSPWKEDSEKTFVVTPAYNVTIESSLTICTVFQ